MLETGMIISIPHISEEIGTTVPGSIGRFNYVSKGVADKIYDAKDFQPQFTLPLYRYGNIRNAQHFYTANWKEIGTNAVRVTIGLWKFEGIAGYIYSMRRSGAESLHRYYQRNKTTHVYTTNASKIGTITPGAVGKFGYTYEGVASYVLTTSRNSHKLLVD
ncbi:unnamed protein product [Rotaria sp. Silwood2]|nr:unnamed protein product [Rotaria sp. Silwood2]CAF2867365.1 unnamed protein product [Rotaria sp. Silwood2]CAF3078166.1 unnamed protein product [Rotaria sp. Silwood2]CAF4303336.1 unnamed protein product [Rotaria sp. Silwood2]CAF4437480.1 unnamed protein product [Rotaria sp. Silwood2]